MKIEKFYVHLEPCPLCNGEAKLWRLIEKDGSISDWYIRCDECGLDLQRGKDKYINQTVQKWNTRKDCPQTDPGVLRELTPEQYVAAVQKWAREHPEERSEDDE